NCPLVASPSCLVKPLRPFFPFFLLPSPPQVLKCSVRCSLVKVRCHGGMTMSVSAPTTQGPKLLDRLRTALLIRGTKPDAAEVAGWLGLLLHPLPPAAPPRDDGREGDLCVPDPPGRGTVRAAGAAGAGPPGAAVSLPRIPPSGAGANPGVLRAGR